MQGRGYQGPGICPLCLGSSEDIEHLFGNCPFFQEVWVLVRVNWARLPAWDSELLISNLVSCFESMGGAVSVTIFTLWEV